MACEDSDWIRLIQWEALAHGDEPVIREEERRASFRQALDDLRARQQRGLLPADLDAGHLLLAIMGLIAYPLAFPQLTRIVTGRSATDATSAPSARSSSAASPRPWPRPWEPSMTAAGRLAAARRSRRACWPAPCSSGATGAGHRGGRPRTRHAGHGRRRRDPRRAGADPRHRRRAGPRHRVGAREDQRRGDEGAFRGRPGSGAGDLLFTIDPRQFQAALLQAQASSPSTRRMVTQAEANLAKRHREARQCEGGGGALQAPGRRGLVAREQYDQIRTTEQTLTATIEADLAAIETAKRAGAGRRGRGGERAAAALLHRDPRPDQRAHGQPADAPGQRGEGQRRGQPDGGDQPHSSRST